MLVPLTEFCLQLLAGDLSKVPNISVASLVKWKKELRTYLLKFWKGLNELEQEKCLKYHLAPCAQKC